MRIKQSTSEDIERINEIFNDAKNHLASLHIDQWQNGYPNRQEIKKDISNHESYLVLNIHNQIVATFMFTLNGESTYKIIKGNWIVNESEKYGVVHRIAIAKEHRKSGIATFIFNSLHQKLRDLKVKSLKIDTHQDNYEMQSLVKRLGYQYCGIIFTNYQAKRLAFEKLIN